MIPYDVDPSLHDHEPGPGVLDDGFSAPAEQARAREPEDDASVPAGDGAPRGGR